MSLLQAVTQHRHFKKSIFFLFILVSAIAWMGMRLYSHYYLSTDDAYVNANVVQIAPRVAGNVSHLFVHNNQYVQKGEALFDIDNVPFQIAVDSARAQVAMNEAQLIKFKGTANRTMPLVKRKYLSPQDGDNVVASLKTAVANLAYAKAGLAQAELNLQYTKVRAPVSGWITNLSLRVGDIVASNQSLFALIGDEEFWVDANFKETELSGIRPGQTATIIADLYPNHPFKGIVESISGGAGAAFSLLPPQNATGNWVKVTQRIPVRIRILNVDPEHQLRVGISTNVTVHLQS